MIIVKDDRLYGSPSMVGTYLPSILVRIFPDLYYTDLTSEEVRAIPEESLSQWLYNGGVDNPRPSRWRLVVRGVISAVCTAAVLYLAGLLVYCLVVAPEGAPVILLLLLLAAWPWTVSLPGFVDHIGAWRRYRRLQHFQERGYIRVDIVKVFEHIIILELGKQFEELGTPLPGSYNSQSWSTSWKWHNNHFWGYGDEWDDVFATVFKGRAGKYRAFALETFANDIKQLDQLVRDNLSVVQLLSESYGCAEMPELEKQALIERLQPSLRAIAVRVDLARRREVDDWQRTLAEHEAHRQARSEVRAASLQGRAHGVLGWSPEEAAARRAFHALEEKQANQAKLSAKGKRLVKQLKSPRREKPKRGKKSRGKKS